MPADARSTTTPGLRGLVVALIVTAASAVPVAWATDAPAESFRQVVAHHLQLYPEIEVQDLYKLAFQAAMGAEHAVPDRDAARQWLEREASSLAEPQGEPCSESLSVDGVAPFGPDQLQEFWVEMVDRGLSAVHHSQTYRQLYRPAYRVVLVDSLREGGGVVDCFDGGG